MRNLLTPVTAALVVIVAAGGLAYAQNGSGTTAPGAITPGTTDTQAPTTPDGSMTTPADAASPSSPPSTTPGDPGTSGTMNAPANAADTGRTNPAGSDGTLAAQADRN